MEHSHALVRVFVATALQSRNGPLMASGSSSDLEDASPCKWRRMEEIFSVKVPCDEYTGTPDYPGADGDFKIMKIHRETGELVYEITFFDMLILSE